MDVMGRGRDLGVFLGGVESVDVGREEGGGDEGGGDVEGDLVPAWGGHRLQLVVLDVSVCVFDSSVGRLVEMFDGWNGWAEGLDHDRCMQENEHDEDRHSGP